MEERMCEIGLYKEGMRNTKGLKHGGILSLENSFLDIGSNPLVAQGVFYMLPIYHNRKLFVRYVR